MLKVLTPSEAQQAQQTQKTLHKKETQCYLPGMIRIMPVCIVPVVAFALLVYFSKSVFRYFYISNDLKLDNHVTLIPRWSQTRRTICPSVIVHTRDKRCKNKRVSQCLWMRSPKKLSRLQGSWRPSQQGSVSPSRKLPSTQPSLKSLNISYPTQTYFFGWETCSTKRN